MSNDMTLLDIMKSAVVIPVIAIDDPDHAVPLAKALVAGGIRVLEVTLRTKHGLEAIRAMAQVEGAIVGVGTLTQPEEFAASRDAGAVFGVSPGLTPALIEAGKKSGLPLLPGCMTPSEVMVAREAGFKQLKLFPAVPADVTFCPTGGISIETAPQFLALKNVACVGGSWLTPADAMKAGDWALITELAKSAAALGKAARA
jgi:2-dehydro-3-deoxyphosphogluconate aldolase / (4S)-4-hydroxy-2-oxoglutarate aldolase